MTKDVFKKTFKFSESRRDSIWEKLQRRETFIKGQLPPYKVEFESGETRGRFNSGEKNIHHGPLLSVHGEIGELTNEYRALHYYYGSYVLSFRLIRPTLLEFFKNQDGIEVRLHCYVYPAFQKIWRFSNNIFWSLFGVGL